MATPSAASSAAVRSLLAAADDSLSISEAAVARVLDGASDLAAAIADLAVELARVRGSSVVSDKDVILAMTQLGVAIPPGVVDAVAASGSGGSGAGGLRRMSGKPKVGKEGR